MSARITAEDDFRHTVDVVRGVAIVGVVAVHFGGSFATPNNAWTPSFELGLLVNQAFSFGVPLFVFLAGLLGRKSGERPDFRFGRFYRHRLLRLLPAYIVVSAASFWLLNHIPEWRAMPSDGERFGWLIQKLFVFGMEPTLYFVPLLIQLTILQPFLARMPRWISARLARGAKSVWLCPDRIALYLAGLLFGLHIGVAHLCFRGQLNYYVWGRPSALFWTFLFFVGLHRDSLIGLLPHRLKTRLFWSSVAIAAGAMALNWMHLHDRSAMGAHFEHSGVDYAYVRPVILVFNLSLVAAFTLWLEVGRPLRQGLLELCGRCTYAIYLWHILFLYYFAWSKPDVLGACHRLPELMILISLFTASVIAAAAEARQLLTSKLVPAER